MKITVVLVFPIIPVSFLNVCEEKFPFTEKLCERLGVFYKQFSKEEIKNYLLGLNERTLIFSVHNSYIFPEEICNKANLTILNMHIAYLPKYRGMNPSTWAIYNQEEYSGVTWHLVSSKIDNGKIIVQKKIEIYENDTAIKLMMKCFKEGEKLFEENLDSFIENNFKTFITENGNTKLYRSKELPNDGFIDFKWDFNKTYAFLRSMDYSGTNIMRLPRVDYKGNVYEIIKYRKIINDKYDCSNSVEQKDNILILKWDSCCLECVIREKKQL